MSNRICFECKEGKLEILGTAGFGDTIEVECNSCGKYFELEPDGLDEGGMEFVEAQMLEIEREAKEGCFIDNIEKE